MTRRSPLKYPLLAFLFFCSLAPIGAQVLEIDSKVRVATIDNDSSVDSLLVLRPDGELARRHVSTLPVITSGWTETTDATYTLRKTGIKTDSPSAILTLDGNYADPLIPGSTSNGILRIGATNTDALDIGKKFNGTFDAWLQAGHNGTIADPISLQPLGGNVGIGVLSPEAKLHVYGTMEVAGIISGVTDPVAIGDVATKAYADNNFLIQPPSPVEGNLLYYDGEDWVVVAPETNGKVLTINDNIPAWTTYSPELYLGKSYQGGYIFYLDATGEHGLIAAGIDQSTDVYWGCPGVLIGNTSTALGTGQANTTAIVNGCNTTGIAARICNDLVYAGYSDWFLPSKDELDLMWTNLADLDGDNYCSGISDPNNIGRFANTYYWSSSEHNSDEAWVQHFGNSNQSTYGKEVFPGIDGHVRAVRSF